MTADTIVYFNAAEFLLEGKGISRMAAEVGYKPVTHFPPLYPASLAGLRLLGLDIETGARWLNAGLIFGLVWLTAYLLQRERQKPWIAALGAALIGFSPILVDIFAWAMSEPLFIVFILLSIACGGAYFRTYDRGALISAGLMAAAAYLTRYSGIALMAALAAAIVLVPRQRFKKRLTDFMVFTAAAAVPALIWVGRNIRVAGSATNRQLAWHPIALSELKRWFHMLYAWLLPLEFTHEALLFTIGVLAILAAGYLVYQARSRFQPMVAYFKQLPDNPLRLLSGWFSLVYAILIIASISLFDASTPLNFRITSPMYVTLVIFALTHLPTQPRWYLSHRLHQAALAGIILLLGSYGYRSVALAGELSLDAGGYASSLLIPSSQVEIIQALPQGTAIYSNNLEAMYYFYDRPALIIPSGVDAVSQLEREGFEGQLEAMRQTLRRGQGVLIIFYSQHREGYPPPVLLEGLELIYSQHDVMIYTGPGMGENFYPE